MSLEESQRLHDLLQARKNNFSGSNDPHQLQHDANEQLINGARIAAAADLLGVEDEEAIQLLMRKGDKFSRRQQRDIDGSEVYNEKSFSVPREVKGFKSRLNTDPSIGDLVDPMDAVEARNSDPTDGSTESKQFARKIQKYRELGPRQQAEKRGVDEKGRAFDPETEERRDFALFPGDGGIERTRPAEEGGYESYVDSGPAVTGFTPRRVVEAEIARAAQGQAQFGEGVFQSPVRNTYQFGVTGNPALFGPSPIPAYQDDANGRTIAEDLVFRQVLDRKEAARAVEIDNFLGRTSTEQRAINDEAAFLESVLIQGRDRQDLALIQQLRAMQGMAPMQVDRGAFGRVNLTADGRAPQPVASTLPQAVYSPAAEAYYDVSGASRKRIEFPAAAQNSNYTDSLQQLNVPTNAPTSDPRAWAVRGMQAFQKKPDGIPTPQADITGMTTLAADQLRATAAKLGVPLGSFPAEGAITDINALGSLAEQINAKQKGAGTDPVTGFPTVRRNSNGDPAAARFATISDALRSSGLTGSQTQELATALVQMEMGKALGQQGLAGQLDQVTGSPGTPGIAHSALSDLGLTGTPVGGRAGDLTNQAISYVASDGRNRRMITRKAFDDVMPRKLDLLEQEGLRRGDTGVLSESTSPTIGIPEGGEEAPVKRNYGHQSRGSQRDYFVAEQARRDAMRKAGKNARPFTSGEMKQQLDTTENLVNRRMMAEAGARAAADDLAAQQTNLRREKAPESEEMINRVRIEREKDSAERTELARLMREGARYGTKPGAEGFLQSQFSTGRNAGPATPGRKLIVPQEGRTVQRSSVPKRSPLVSDPWEGEIEFTRPVSKAATQQTQRVLALPPGQPPRPNVQQAAAAGSEPPRAPQGSAGQRHLPRFGNRTKMAGGLLAAAGTGAGLSYLANRNEREEEMV